MTLDRFWSIIREAKENSDDDLDTMYEALFCSLETLELRQLMEWAQILELYYTTSRTTKLRRAVIQACGDDDSDHLCGWLLAQGRELYHQVLREPERLEALVEHYDTQFGEIMSIVPNVYLKKIHVKEWVPEYYVDAKAKYPLSKQMQKQIAEEVAYYNQTQWERSAMPRFTDRCSWSPEALEQ